MNNFDQLVITLSLILIVGYALGRWEERRDKDTE